MEKIKWGIIGCGDVTEIKSGPAFNKVPHSELVAVMRRDAGKAADYARRHKVPRWYSDAQQLIDDPEINAIYVATPPDSHETYTIRALAAGKPVYVEKPISVNSASAAKMLQASVDTGMKLSVAHYRKAQPRFKYVKALLDTNAIGAVRLINLQLVQPLQSVVHIITEQPWRLNPAISGGGLFHDLSPHQLDLLQYFFGEIVTASGFAMNQGKQSAADDLVTGTIVFNQDIVFNGSWCFTGAPGEEKDSIEIIGSEGSICFTTFSTNHITLTKRGEVQQITFDELPHVQQPMIEAVVTWFLGHGSNPSSAADALVTMNIIDAFTNKLAGSHKFS